MARHTTKLSPIGQCYLFEVAHRDGTYFTESDFLPRGQNLTQADALAGARQQDDLVAVWELNPAEGGMRDVSEDIARAMLDASEAMEEDELPAFILAHLPNSEVDEHFAALAAQRVHERGLASPEVMGRV